MKNNEDSVEFKIRQQLLTAARELLETLGGEEGYFSGAGKEKTDALRKAVRLNGGRIVYQRGTSFEVEPR